MLLPKETGKEEWDRQAKGLDGGLGLERRAGKNQAEERTWRGKGFSPGSGDFKVFGQHEGENPHTSGGVLPVNSTWLPINLEEPHLLSPKPQGLLGPNAFCGLVLLAR